MTGLEADRLALEAIARVQPRWTGLLPAAQAIDFPPATLLHAGPAFAEAAPVPAVVLNSAAAAVLFEGWAADRDAALHLLGSKAIRLAPAQDHGCAVPLASVLSPSQQVQRVEDAAAAARPAFAPLNGGNGPALRLGLPTADVVAHLRWLNGPLAVALRPACERGIALLPIADRALAAGDDCHGRTAAATAGLLGALALDPDSAADGAAHRFLVASPSFFLNLWMAAVKTMLGAAVGLADSSIVTAMGANGVEVGLQLAARPGLWHLAPSTPPNGPLADGITADDRLPAIGDSMLVEAFGFGAMAFAHSPLQMAALGDYLPEAPAALAAALLGSVHPAFVRSKARFGLAARRVVAAGRAPAVALGVLDRHGRRGRLGGGIWQAGVAHFERALAASGLDRSPTLKEAP